MPEPDMSHQRRTMVDGQIRTFDVTDNAVIERFLVVPRENFVGAEMAALSYSDAGLRLTGQPPRIMLAPMFLARMIQGAQPKAASRVLDIGSGLGYSCAVLAGLVAQVVAVESDAARVAATLAACKGMGIGNVTGISGELGSGYPQMGPYDIIIVNGAIEIEPTSLLAQLADGGCLIAIVNKPGEVNGQAVRYDASNGVIGRRALFNATAAVLEGMAALPVFEF